MEDEKGFLKKDLEKATTREEIENLARDAREFGHEDVAKLAEEKLATLSSKAEVAGATSAEKVKQVESLGGSGDEIINRTAEVDGEIDKLRSETEIKIKEVVQGTDDKGNESALAEAEKKRAQIERDIKITELLLEYDRENKKLQDDSQQVIFNKNVFSEIDVLSTDSPEVQEKKRQRYQEIIKPFNERRKELDDKLAANGISDPAGERAKFYGEGPWKGKFEDAAMDRMEKLRAELAKL